MTRPALRSLGAAVVAPAVLALAALVMNGCDRRSAGTAATETHTQTIGAEGASLTLTLSTTSLDVAHRLEVTLVVHASADADIRWPDLSAHPDLGDFAVGEPAEHPATLDADGRIESRRSWSFEPFLPGERTVPALRVEIRPAGTADGQPVVLTTAPVAVSVRSVLDAGKESTPELRSVAAPEEVRGVAVPLAITASVALLAGGAVAAGVFRRARGRARPESPIERARSALGSLAIGHDGASLRAEYARLSIIVRAYLAERFGLGALDLTSEELLGGLEARASLVPEVRATLSALLAEFDAVNYAGGECSAADASALRARTAESIELTERSAGAGRASRFAGSWREGRAMSFGSPWAFALLVLAPLTVWLLLRPSRHRPLEFSSVSVIGGVRRSWRVRLLPLPALLRTGAVIALVVAVARPQHGIGRIETSTEAVAIQLVIDRSRSMSEPMTYENEVLTRLETVQRVVRSFVLGDGDRLKGRRDDLIGMIVFGTFAQTACPLVRDPGILVELSDAVTIPETQSEGATAIGDGLALAAARLERIDEDIKNRRDLAGTEPLSIKSKVIILLTDGVQTAGEKDPLQAAELARQWGIKIYTIGIGSPGRASFLDRGVDEPTLRRVAEMTGGVYQRATDAESLKNVYAKIDALERTTIRTASYTDFDERFTAFAAAAAALVMLETLLGATVLRRSPG